MSTFAFVDTYAHTVTYVTDKLLLCLKDIIRESGLSPAKMTQEWATLERGISAWIGTKHLEKIVLEIFNPTTSALVSRWDLEIIYGYGGPSMGGYRRNPLQHQEGGPDTVYLQLQTCRHK